MPEQFVSERIGLISKDAAPVALDGETRAERVVQLHGRGEIGRAHV